MLWILWIAAAVAGGMVIDAEVPVQVLVNDRPYVQMYHPGQSRFDYKPGPAEVTLLINGKPKRLAVTIPETGHLQLIVGRNGISHAQEDNKTPASTETEVVFRAMGTEAVQVRLGEKRHIISPDAAFSTSLTTGRHLIEVRNNDGTLIWAKGQLELSGLENVVVQLAEGRMPEVIGNGSQFLTRSR